MLFLNPHMYLGCRPHRLSQIGVAGGTWTWGERLLYPLLWYAAPPRAYPPSLLPHALLLLLFLVCVLVLVSCAAVVGLSVVPALPVGAPSGVAIVASGSAWVSCCALLLLCYFV